MVWPEDITDGLPAPHDDEPACLRQDIVDELSDHLSCALDRELRANDDNTKAKKNVLDRFGNPARIAYRLWFDAMKERIMSHRLTLAATVVSAGLCIFMGAMTWQLVRQSREDNLALLQQIHESDSAILDKLSTVTLRPNDNQPPDWTPVKFQLVSGQTKGAPAGGFNATLRSSQDTQTLLEKTSDANGLMDFGYCRNGLFELSLTAPWGESTKKTITVRPGEDFLEEVICPNPAKQCVVNLQVQWPDELKRERLWALCSFETDPQRFSDWTWTRKRARCLLVSESGELTGCSIDPYEDHREGIPRTVELNSNANFQIDDREWKLVRICVLRRLDDGAIRPGLVELPQKPLSAFNFSHFKFAGHVATQNSFYGMIVGSGLDEFGPPQQEGGEVKHDDERVDAPVRKIEPGQANDWNISLPVALATRVREQLATAQK